MRVGVAGERGYVVYRAIGRGNRLVEVHLVAAPGSATVADAWARLSRLDPTVDPRSLEIETRRLPPRPSLGAPARAADRRPTPPIDLARWLAARAEMAHHAGP